MKRDGKRFGAAVLLALGAAAQAQTSSVTLSGVADAAGRYVSNEGRGSVKSLVSGSNSTSKLIVRGVEDLGGGLSAGFHLEHGLQLDSGAQVVATQFWDRRATVMLASRTLGEIRLGRDYVLNYINWNRYDPFAYVGAGGSNNFITTTPTGPVKSAFGTGLATTVRSSDAVEYLLPAGLGGLEGGVMMSAGEGGTTVTGQNKYTGLRLGYTRGEFSISATASRTENNLTAASGGHAFTDRVVAGSYDFHVVQVSLALRQFRQLNAKQTNTLLGLWVPLGQGTVKLSWNRTNLAGKVGATSIDANDAQQFALGYVYDLSKRSALYTTASFIDNKGAATFVVPGGPAGLAGGGSSKGFEVGMRHSF